MKNWLKGVCLVLLVLGFCFFPKAKQSFDLDAISSKLSYQKEWDLSSSSPLLDTILDQSFSYLAAGSQSYAFLSEDGKYVLKFFKMKRLNPKLFSFGKTNKRQKRADELFGALKLSYEQFKEESGLQFIHLNRTKHLNKRVQLITKTGEKIDLSLYNVPFIIQERAELIYDHLSSLLNKNDQKAVEEALKSFFSLIQKRGEKGLIDLDTGITNNFGYANGRAIQIDTGRLVRVENQSGASAQELARISSKIELWLKERHPEFLPKFKTIVEKYKY